MREGGGGWRGGEGRVKEGEKIKERKEKASAWIGRAADGGTVRKKLTKKKSREWRGRYRKR